MAGGLVMLSSLVVYWLGVAYESGIKVEMHKCRAAISFRWSLFLFCIGLAIMVVFE